jgi:hypothetical protein
MKKSVIVFLLLVVLTVLWAEQAAERLSDQIPRSNSRIEPLPTAAGVASAADQARTTSATAEPIRVLAYNDIDEIRAAGTDPATGLQHTAWGVYEDIMYPGTDITWDIGHVTSPSRDGSALKCAITGGDQYNNIFCNTTIAKRWTGAAWPYYGAKRLVYSLWFYVDGTIDCQNPNRSTIEGLEFGWQHTLIPVKHEFAVQWSKGGAWRYWDATIDPATGRPRAWKAFPAPIAFCLADRTWHQIQFESYFLGDDSYYTAMLLDGVRYKLAPVKVGRAQTAEGWHENFLQLSVQINGNTALDGSRRVDPVTVYLDQVRLEGFTLPAVFVPLVRR